LTAPVGKDRFPLLDDRGVLHPKVTSTIKDVFRKFDLLSHGELGFMEFRGFY
jgi:hypothetical protein